MKSGIICKFQGGLGNQMFQYAAARALQEKLGGANRVALKFDARAFTQGPKDDTLRKLEIQKFNTKVELAVDSELREYFSTGSTFLDKVRRRLAPFLNSSKVYKEPHFEFDKNFFSLNAPRYFEGYFQSEKYFSQISDALFSEFQLLAPLPPEIEKWASLIQTQNSCFVHIRRGDYLKPEVRNYHGGCTPLYYESSIELIASKEPDTRFYFFSDDAQWTEQTFSHLKNAEFVKHPYGHEPQFDMYLMSLCSKAIMANSSFSWWSVWLSKMRKHPFSRVIIAPEHWFRSTQNKTHDLYSNDWIKRDNWAGGFEV